MDPTAPVPKVYPHLELNEPITRELVHMFAQDKCGSRLPNDDGTKQPDDYETKQQRDYEQKLNSIRTSYELRYRAPLTLEVLTGPRIERIIKTRRDRNTKRPVRPSTRNAYRTYLKSFTTWLFTTRIVDGPIKCKVTPEKEDKKAAPVTYAQEEIERVFRELQAEDTVASRRLFAIVMLILDGGLRNNEVCELILADMNRAQGWMRVTGKALKERFVPVSQITWRAIDRYLQVRHSPLAHVFMTDNGKGVLRPDALNRQLNAVLTDLQMVEHLSKTDLKTQPDLKNRPRSRAGLNIQAIRRTFANHYANSGRTDGELEAIMGWSPNHAHETRRHYVASRSVSQLKAVHAQSTMVTSLHRSR
jgi:site-specific recombinase XerD